MKVVSLRAFALLLFYALWLGAASAQLPVIQRVEPASWWVGMKHSRVELMFYGKDLGKCSVSSSYKGISIHQVSAVENPNYLFVEIDIAPTTKPGTATFDFALAKGGKPVASHPFLIAARTGAGADNKRIQGLSPADIVYLLMPDRFANGDPSNDYIATMKQKKLPIDSMYARHGGDLQGVINHLDYFNKIGVTALWLNPVIENDQPRESYHGYAATDFYKIDPRFGTNELYKKLVDEAHAKGIKIVWDLVHNHIGSECWWYKDLPDRNWLHNFPEFTRTSFRATALMDPYVSEKDHNTFANGWFDKHMPDLNQQDVHLAKYLTQNNIWWVEYAGIDAFRVDTYAYPDQKFMAEWGQAMLTEFPKLSIFGETWVQGVPVQSWFTKGNGYKSGVSNLPGVTDFQLYYAMQSGLNEDFGWDNGLAKIYNTLCNDFVYEDPTRNVIFLDNHDIGRFFSDVKEDMNKYKQGIGLLFTTRGIPQIYYGTEILMKNYFDWGNHDKVRLPFPGGFADGQADKFDEKNLSATEKEAFTFFSTLATYRRSSSALTQGKLTHFIPDDGTYVYFRRSPTQTVMVMINQKKEAKTLDMKRFTECMGGKTSAKNVITNEKIAIGDSMSLPAQSITILELQ